MEKVYGRKTVQKFVPILYEKTVRVTNLQPVYIRAVYTSQSVEKIMSFVNDDDWSSQVDPTRFPCVFMQECVVGDKNLKKFLLIKMV